MKKRKAVKRVERKGSKGGRGGERSEMEYIARKVGEESVTGERGWGRGE